MYFIVEETWYIWRTAKLHFGQNIEYDEASSEGGADEAMGMEAAEGQERLVGDRTQDQKGDEPGAT